MKLRLTLLVILVLHAAPAYLLYTTDSKAATAYALLMAASWAFFTLLVLFYNHHAAHRTPYQDDISEDTPQAD
jgi:predicted MFS family arabinose efflux permease